VVFKNKLVTHKILKIVLYHSTITKDNFLKGENSDELVAKGPLNNNQTVKYYSIAD
jgi:hypothetical protein